MKKFDGGREEFQVDIAKRNKKLKAVRMKLDRTLAQLEQLKEVSLERKEVRWNGMPSCTSCIDSCMHHSSDARVGLDLVRWYWQL